jgi:LEA14-like dessication related protein
MELLRGKLLTLKDNNYDFVFSLAFIVIILVSSIVATPYIIRVSFAKSSLQDNSTLQDPPTIASISKQAQQLSKEAQEQKPISKPTTTPPPSTTTTPPNTTTKPTTTPPNTTTKPTTTPPPSTTTTPPPSTTTTPPPSTTTTPPPTTAATPSSSQNVKGPVKVAFVDSYWTDNAAPEAVVAGSSSTGTTTPIPPVVKQEVGPGEGPSTLVVVLINQGFSDITGITGSLKLPSGFEPIITPKRSSIPGADSQTALTSYDGIVSAGQTFTLYFAVNVSKDAQVGRQYLGDLKIGYFDVTEQNSKNSRSETTTVPFTLPGKVVLDAVSASASSFTSVQTLNLVPDTPNVVKLTIRNEGSATANGVVVTISGGGSTANTNSINVNAGNSSSGLAQQPSSSSTVNLGITTFNIGTIIAGRNATIDPIVYPSISAAGTVQNLNLGISYNDGYGNKKTSNQLIGLQIVPSSPQSGLSVSPSSFFSSSSSSTTAVAFPSSSSSDNNSNANIDPKQSPPLPSSNTFPSIIQITAGKIQDLKFTINNNNNDTTGSIPNSITDLAVSLVSQSNSVRILGPSSWNLQSINPQSAQELSTQIFASSSLIGDPVFFTVNLQYIQNGHQLKTASFNLGAIVVGDIKISVNDVGIRYIGDTPYLVGNLLNQGNTPALFTSIEMLNQGQIETQRQQQQSPSTSFSSPSSSAINKNFRTTLLPISSQYVGNLAENSPLSFRIPLKIVRVPTTAEEQSANNSSAQNTTTVRSTMASSSSATSPSITIDNNNNNNNTAPGIYPVSLKITYSDDLKNSHELVVNNTISFDFEQTQGEMPGQQQPTQQPIFTNGFIDSYWAANTAVNGGGTTGNSSATGPSASPPQQELGPGDGKATLAIVLSNTGFSDISGIVGYLTLPLGFSATSDSSTTNSNNQTNVNLNQQQMQLLQEPAIAGLNNVVKAGQTYTLYFKVNILKTATVGTHSASLRLNYFEVPELEPGKYSSETFTIPFTLSGKVILDAVPKITDLTPGISNEPKIEIENKGTADAHGVIVTVTGVSGNSITGGVSSSSNNNLNGVSNSSSNISPNGGEITTTSPSSIPTVNLGARTFDIGTIPVNGTTEITPVIYPSDSAGGTLQNLNLQLLYSDANGDTKSSSISVGFRVLPTPPETGLSVTPSNATTSSNTNSNNNPGISVAPSHTTFSNTNPSDNYHNVAASFFTPRLQRIYAANNNNNNNNDINNLNNTSLIFVAGKMEDMSFDITNNNDVPITNAVISISSQSNDLKIIGDSLWSLQSLNPHSKHTFSTKIYASTSLIGSPVSFIVTTQYISGAQSKIGSFNLGANVVGDIKVSVTDLAINYIAGTPNLVGNLLNQGNTVALFTTVQMINQPFSSSSGASGSGVIPSSVSNGTSSTSKYQNDHLSGSVAGRNITRTSSFASPPQYLGDLQADSPLPFSIPINVDNNTAPGIYPVSLKITYSDDLKNSHELVVNNTVTIKPEQRQQLNDRGQNLFGGREGILGIPFPIIIAIIAAIAIVAVIIIVRRLKSTAIKNLVVPQVEQERSNNRDEDIESLIDDDDRNSDKRNDDTSDTGEMKHGS